ncbi:MAG: hypothetical protein J0G99_01055 [Alphaproteobacteria bacterium]|nr:hypothetical protein [Alphaproteobacteria bacterium]
MRRGWFGPKLVGWGPSPRSWQGWLATALFVVALVGGNVLLRHTGWGAHRLNRLVVDGALLAVFLAMISLTYDANA